MPPEPQPENPYVAVVVTVPEEYFSDEDDICLAAARFVCAQLEDQLIEDGHDVPDWIQGGCDEDWGVCYETLLAEDRFDYAIMFFPEAKGVEQRSMMVQYQRKYGFWKSLFHKPPVLAAEHPLHASMERFGKRFDSHRMLTKAELDREY